MGGTEGDGMSKVETPPAELELVVVTGMSGAGRSSVAKELEDLGWFVMDNLPPDLLTAAVQLGVRSQGAVSKMAVVTDLRSRALGGVEEALQALDRDQVTRTVVFLDASDEVLVKRFDGVRRPHPLEEDGRVALGIRKERALLAPLKELADVTIDTSGLTIHQLRAKVREVLGESEELHVSLVSFGYKHGVVLDADLVLDCRFVPNPHWVPELRPQTGRDAPVREYVLGHESAKNLLETYERFLEVAVKGYRDQGLHRLVLGVGCTGGKHRSVAVAEELARRLQEKDVKVTLTHRDVERE